MYIYSFVSGDRYRVRLCNRIIIYIMFRLHNIWPKITFPLFSRFAFSRDVFFVVIYRAFFPFFWCWRFFSRWCWNESEQEGRLPPAYFSPNYKYFDPFLQAVKKTTVLVLVFKEFLQINSTTDFCTLCKRVSRFSLEKKFVSQCRKISSRNPSVFQKTSVIEKC